MKKATPMILCLVLLNLALLNSLVCVGGQAADSPWPTYQGDVKHTGLSPYDTSEISGGLKWYVNLSDPIESSPVISSDGTIYITTVHGELYAIYPNGTIKWNFTKVSSVTPVIDPSGNIYISGTISEVPNSYFLFSLSPNGSERWRFKADKAFLSPIIDPSGNLYVCSMNGTFYSIYPDGSERWNITISGYSTFCTPAIADDGTIYYATRSTGNTGKLYAIDPSGFIRWNYTTGDVARTPTIDDDNRIYVATLTGDVYCIDSDGILVWENKLSHYSIFSSPAIGSDGTIYVGTSEDRLYALDPINGQIIWTSERIIETNSGINTSPAIGSDGAIYFQSNSAKLFALDENGNFKWYFTPPHLDDTYTAEISSPAIGSDGTIYYGISDGYLYALGPDDPPVAYFEIYPPEGNASTGFWFDASNSTDNEDESNMLTYEWDFGDGNTGTGIIVNHTYGHNGNYSILLTVTDSTGKSDNYTLDLSVDSQIIKRSFISESGLIIYGIANLIPLFLFVSQQRRKYEDTEQSDIDPVVSEAEDDDIVGIGIWFLSRRIPIYWFAILMIFDLVTTYIALSNGLGYELNPFGRWLFNFESGYAILLFLKFIVIILLAFSVFRTYKIIKQNHIHKNSIWYYSEIIIWTFMIGAMIFTVGNNLNVIL